MDDANLILESSVLNVVVVGHDDVLRTPPFRKVLRGTTVRKIFELARATLLPPHGTLLTAISQEEIHLNDVRACKELMLVAGDTHVFPCTSLDGKPIGDGAVGKVSSALLELVESAARADGDEHEAVPELEGAAE